MDTFLAPRGWSQRSGCPGWLVQRLGFPASPRPHACHGRLDLPTESGEEAPAAPRFSAPPLPLARSPAARRPPGANFRGL